MARQSLIVEDEADTAALLHRVLCRKGFEPTLLSKGQSASSWVRQHRPDLILLDLILPDIDGYDICEELKLDRETNLIPIIMVTGRTRFEDEVRGLQVGANYYLRKPFTLPQLDRAIEEVLAWRERLERCGMEGEIHFQMNSHTRYLEELNQLLGALLHFTCLSPQQIRQLVMAVREIGANAIEWGHKNQVKRIVDVTYRIEADKVVVVIHDMGSGFDRQHLQHAARPDDPVSHMAIREGMGLRDGGLGILMAGGLVDELEYNEAGNEARLVKYCESSPRAGGLPAAATEQS
jgi:DNA-binding response OmpR family regulator